MLFNVVRTIICSIFSIFSILILINSCQTGTERDSYEHNPSSALPVSGKAYWVIPPSKPRQVSAWQTVETNLSTELKVDGKWNKTKQHSLIQFLYSRQTDTLQQETISARYNRIQISIEKDGEKEEMDSNNPPTALHSVDNILRDIKGSDIRFVFDKNGELIHKSGQEEITGKVMKGLQHFNESERTTVQALLDMFTSEALFKSNNLSNQHFFPTDTLQLAQAWTRYDSVQAMIKLVTQTTYTLRAIDDSIAVVDMEGKITNGRSESVPVMGSFMDVDLGGKLEGQVRINLFTRLIISMESDLTVKGNLSLRGKEYPVSIRQTKKTKARNI